MASSVKASVHKKAAGKKGGKGKVREVKYPTKRVELYFNGDGGLGGLTVEKAKEILDWKVVDDAEGALLTDHDGNHIICGNNHHNRPFAEAWAKQFAQDILNRNWRFNGESIIIGRTGLVLSGQHRLIGLILAAQLWASDDPDVQEHWAKKWDSEPELETLIVYGVDESNETTRTLDNVKPRTLSDVLFCDAGVFHNRKIKDREKLCRMVEHAVRLLWHRTGAKLDSYSPRQTHSESMDFIARHKTVLEAVNTIFDENQGEAISKYIGAGQAAGLFYLMASCDSDGDAYLGMNPPSEKKLSFDYKEKAREFFASLGNKDAKEFDVVRSALGELQGGSAGEKQAVLVRAWNAFANGDTLTKSRVDISGLYKHNKNGIPMLGETPIVGGIDQGNPKKPKKEEEDIDTEGTEDKPVKSNKGKHTVEKDGVESRKAVEKAKKQEGKAKAKGKPQPVDEDSEDGEEVPEFKPIKTMKKVAPNSRLAPTAPIEDEEPEEEVESIDEEPEFNEMDLDEEMVSEDEGEGEGTEEPNEEEEEGQEDE